MKKIKIKQVIIFTVIFIVGVLIIVGEGIYKKSLSQESIGLGINIPSENAKAIVYDIATNEGIAKRLAQPGRISIGTGHGKPLVVNKSKEPVSVQVKASGFSGDVQITSTDSSFDEETGTFKKAIQPEQGLNLSVLLDVPRSQVNKNIVSDGNIEFTDYKSGKVIATLPIKVINSSVS